LKPIFNRLKQNSRSIIYLVFPLFLAACSSTINKEPVVILGTAVPPVPTLDINYLTQGKGLYDRYCGSCHGEDLAGEPDWKQLKEGGTFPAPPHDATGHTWHHPDDLILEITSQGGDPAYGGTMPGFGEQLSKEEIRAILEYIKTSWGEQERAYQWWITNQQ
jgi:mono/diheme cytochrome c family protein